MEPDPLFRIGAIHSVNETTVEFFGYGYYLGDEIPPSNIKFLGIPVLDEIPKLRLDSGDIIWGCECLWGDVEYIDDELKGKEMILVTVEDTRKIG